MVVTLIPGPDEGTSTLRYLMVCELTEAFMHAQGKGWFPGPGPGGAPGNEGNIGEGLSRFLGASSSRAWDSATRRRSTSSPARGWTARSLRSGPTGPARIT